MPPNAPSIILPQIEGESVGKHQLVHWFMRSVYERNPPKPKYSWFWDVSEVFSNWPSNQNVSLRNLSIKLAVLLLLTTGHRGQTIVALSLHGLKIDRNEATFDLKTLIKSNRTGEILLQITKNR